MTNDHRYPRTCRNGHEVLGPDDEVLVVNARGRGLTCAVCKRAARRRTQQRRVESGKHAETQARYDRRRAEARITRSGVETKTKNADT